MISRKIEKVLKTFFDAKGEYALLIDGARQVGKTFIIEEFGRTHYESVIKIDFVKMKGAVELFQKFYAPVYMAMFLRKVELPEGMICDLGAPIKF